MTHRPTAWTPAVLAIMGLFAITLTTATAPAHAQTPPFDAVVIEANTQVRSGAGRAYYEVGSLDVGAKVVVEAELFGWYKIECPEGVFCFVERKNVNVRGDGSLGVIETDGTPINAAHATKGPADSYRNLMKLDAGDTVEIVAEVNNAYKIKPPKNAYVFLPPGSIEPAANRAPSPVAPEKPALLDTPDAPERVETPEPPAAVVVAPPVAPKPQAEPAAETVVVNPPAPKPAVVEPVAPSPAPERETISFDSAVDAPEVPATPAAAKPVDLLNDPMVDVAAPDVEVKTQATNEMLRAVEVAMLPYLSLPVDQQPIAKMVRGYADAAQIAELSDSDLAIVRARLTQLERNRELATALAEADAVTAEVNDGIAPTDSETGTMAATDPLADAETPTDDGSSGTVAFVEPANQADATETETETAVTPPAPAAPAVSSGYDAVGILTASTVHTGANQPVLLRLLDPTGRRTVAYLEPDESIDTVQMIGRVVGIVGEAVYDPTTRLNLIRPTRVDILSPN